MRRSYDIFKTWIWELLSVALAIGLVNTIAVLLATYNGKRADDWNLNVNFNALLAILSTILRAVLVVIVSQVISQRKWDWFRKGRVNPLSDLQQFDSGSRGSFGALLLIPTVLRKDFVTVVAAVVFLATFLVGPFVQLASRTAECKFPVPGQNASIPFAHHVPRQGGFRPFTGNGGGRATPDTVVAILSALTASKGVENQTKVTCGTGNCTFPGGDPRNPQDGVFMDDDLTTHSTVAMCSKCVDVTSLMSRVNISNRVLGPSAVAFRLPTGLNVNISIGEATFTAIEPSTDLNWMGDTLTPEMQSASRWAYVNATFLATPLRHDDGSQVAAVCSIYPCLRTYTSNITNNRLVERQVESKLMQVNAAWGDKSTSPGTDIYLDLSTNGRNNTSNFYTTVKSPCRVGGEIYDISTNMSLYPGGTRLILYDFIQPTNGSGPLQHSYKNFTAPEQCIYRQNPAYASAISVVLAREVFNGYCTSYGEECHIKGFESHGQYIAGMPDLGVDTVLRTLWNNGSVGFPDIERWFESFATAMTNRFRFDFGAAEYDSTKTVQDAGEIHGLSWQTTLCISIHWEWLLLPAGLTLVTAVLSICTLVTNWRHRDSRPVWKDSILPLIFYGHKIESEESKGLMRKESGDSGRGYFEGSRDQFEARSREGTLFSQQQNSLLEASEMKAVGDNIMVAFRWADDKEVDPMENRGKVPVSGLQKERSWLRQRIP